MNREDIKQQVQAATDLVRLIGEHVALRARGREFVGLCPFHDDRNPSMNVVPHKQIYKCFACGAGGDCFSFVMDYHKMSFPEALRYLAERANIKLPAYRGDSGEGGPSPRERLLGANQQALSHYRKRLQHPQQGAAARDYIAQRGISPEMVQTFQLGLAADSWDDLTRTAINSRWDTQAFEQAGLIVKRNSGEGYYDRLRHRLIFPILDNIGRPIAFGGRILPGSGRDDSSDAKYLNSPETPLFNKSATLYGLHAAQKPIIDSRIAVIVEGYVDVIACHQAGYRNVVATLGTALTTEHARVLRRYCDRVVLVFDGDEAGQKAADRALQVFFNESLDIGIAVLPDEKDPADLMADPEGIAQWSRATESATDALTFQFDRIRSRFEATDTLAGRQRIAEEYLQNLAQLGISNLSPQRRGLIFAQIAQLIGQSPGVVQEQFRKLAAQSAHRPDPQPAAPDPTRLDQRLVAERQLLGALLNRPDLFDTVLADGRPIGENFVSDDFGDPAHHALFHRLSEWLHENHRLANEDFRAAFTDEPILRLAMELQLEADRLADSDPAKLQSLAVRNAQAMLKWRSEQEYLREKLEIGQDAANDEHPQQTGHKRLELAVAHIRNNPSAKRTPRIVGG